MIEKKKVVMYCSYGVCCLSIFLVAAVSLFSFVAGGPYLNEWPFIVAMVVLSCIMVASGVVFFLMLYWSMKADEAEEEAKAKRHQERRNEMRALDEEEESENEGSKDVASQSVALSTAWGRMPAGGCPNARILACSVPSTSSAENSSSNTGDVDCHWSKRHPFFSSAFNAV